MGNIKTNISTKQKRVKLAKQMWRHRALYLMALPSMITMFIFHYIPIYGVQIAFKNYRSSLGIFKSEWVGLKWFEKFISHPNFLQIMWNTFSITLVGLLFFPIPIIFSLMLNEMKNLKLKKICQTITYAPHFMSTIVVCSLITLMLNKNTGVINNLIDTLGGARRDFLGIPEAFTWIFNISGAWQNLGWDTIIFLAALAGVSPELIDAAKIDGATRLQVIRHVNFPHIKPTIIILFILRMGGMLSVGFEKVFALQNPLNLGTSQVISTYVYEIGIEGGQFSYSSAIGLFQNIVSVILVLSTNFISKKVTKTALW